MKSKIHQRRQIAGGQRPRIIVFGTGQGGRLAIERLSKRCTVIAVLDNNPAVQGSRFCGVPVLPPERVIRLKFDWICLASIYRDEMANQLQSLGVPFHCMRDGSVTGWDRLGMPRSLFSWTCRRTVLVGSPPVCQAVAESLAQYFEIIGIHDSDTSFHELMRRGVEQYVIASPDPLRELRQLMDAGVPLDSIEILSQAFTPRDILVG
jgi:hypothetical protein